MHWTNNYVQQEKWQTYISPTTDTAIEAKVWKKLNVLEAGGENLGLPFLNGGSKLQVENYHLQQVKVEQLCPR